MIFHRLASIHRNQKGFTLVEVIMAITITSLIGGGIVAGIFQILNVNALNITNMTAVKQIENAGHWISRDGQMAETVTLSGDEDGFPLKLSWTDWDGTANVVTYTIAGGELRRSHSENGLEISQNLVAQYINSDPIKTNATVSGTRLIVTITATVNDGSQIASKTRVCEVTPRPSLE